MISIATTINKASPHAIDLLIGYVTGTTLAGVIVHWTTVGSTVTAGAVIVVETTFFLFLFGEPFMVILLLVSFDYVSCYSEKI